MSLVGAKLAIVAAADPTKLGLAGEVLLDRANTLVLASSGRRLVVEKKGTVFQIQGTKKVVAGTEVLGRYEDRLRSSRK